MAAAAGATGATEGLGAEEAEVAERKATLELGTHPRSLRRMRK